MPSKIVMKGLDKATRELDSPLALKALAAAAYQYALTSGLARRLKSSPWPDNNPEWRKRKGGKGPWELTGKTLKSISNNPIKRGKKSYSGRKGIRFGVSTKLDRAWIVPMTFSEKGQFESIEKSQRQNASLQFNSKVFRTLQWGGAIHKLRAYAAKKGRRLEDVLGEVHGPSNRERERATKTGYLGIPARPLFKWQMHWEPFMQRDTDRAIKELFREAGFTVRD